MSRTREQAIADAIARKILSNTRKRFSTLHSEALFEVSNMSNEKSSSVTSSMNVSDTPAARAAIGREIPDNPQSLAAAAPARLTPAVSSDSINSGMSVTSQVPAPAATPVDFNGLTSDAYPGDHRQKLGDVVKASLDACTDNGGPRNSVGQFKNSKSDNGAPFQTTVDSTEVGG